MGDCKGFCALAFGSMLSMLMEDPRLGRVKADRLMALEDFRKTWYSQHPGTHQLKRFRVANFTDSYGWANLTSPTVKAANTRAATPMMRDMAVLWFGRGTPIDNAVLRLMSCLAEYYDVLYGEDLFMRDSSVARIRDLCNRIGSDWMVLRNWSALNGKLWWKYHLKCIECNTLQSTVWPSTRDLFRVTLKKPLWARPPKYGVSRCRAHINRMCRRSCC